MQFFLGQGTFWHKLTRLLTNPWKYLKLDHTVDHSPSLFAVEIGSRDLHVTSSKRQFVKNIIIGHISTMKGRFVRGRIVNINLIIFT